MRSADGRVLVSGRAFSRPGFHGFYRGGVQWPSEGERIALVTPELFSVLRSEKMLAVSEHSGDGIDLESVDRLELPKLKYVDEGARALEDANRIAVEIAKEKALLDNEKQRSLLQSLRAERVALEKSAKKSK